MDDTKRTENGQTDTDAALATLIVDRKPNRKRTILVHPDIAESLSKNHADAERMIANMP